MVVGDVGLSLLQPKGLQLWMLSRLWIKVLEQLILCNCVAFSHLKSPKAHPPIISAGSFSSATKRVAAVDAFTAMDKSA